MKTAYLVGVAALTALLTTLLMFPFTIQEPVIVEHVTYTPEPHLSPSQVIWLAQLMQCESGIKRGAVNPNDKDGTPSFGILQFKPETFAWASQMYNAGTTDHMNAEAQVEIVSQWILDRSVDFSQQFPACVDRLGLPPYQAL